MAYKYGRSRSIRWTYFLNRRCCVAGAIITTLTLFFVSTQLRLDMEEVSFFRKIKVVKNSWFERQYVGSWIQGKLLAMKWESYVNDYCKKGKSLALGKSFTQDDYLKYTVKIGEQLGFQDGHSIFDNGCGCGAFLAAFNLTFKGATVGGLDLSPGAIAFAKETFSKADNFKVGTVEDLSFVKTGFYDHAMTFFTFPYVNPEVQCKAVKEMMRIVKPGGTLYIGHNLESDCKDKFHIGVYTLPLCYWNEQCLADRDDIEEIYYIKERDLFGVIKYCPEKSAVFVHKKGGDNTKIPKHPAKYHCDSKLPPSGKKSLN